MYNAKSAGARSHDAQSVEFRSVKHIVPLSGVGNTPCARVSNELPSESSSQEVGNTESAGVRSKYYKVFRSRK